MDVENSSEANNDLSMKVGSKVLRYIIPFKINNLKTSNDFSHFCKNILNSEENLLPPHVTNNLIKIKDEYRVKGSKGPICSEQYEDSSDFRWIKNCLDNGVECDIYDYLKNEFTYEEDKFEDKIGASFKLVKSNYKEIENNIKNQTKDRWGHKFSYALFTGNSLFVNKDSLCDFDINGMWLYIFRNGLCFFCYEINVNIDDADDLLKFQYDVRELSRSKYFKKVNKDNEMSIRLKNQDEEDNYFVPVSFAHWFHQIIIKTLGVNDGEISYLASRKDNFNKLLEFDYIQRNKLLINEVSTELKDRFYKNENSYGEVSDKPVLFTYITSEALNEKEQTYIDDYKKELMFHFCNGYKDSYFYSNEAQVNLYQPYANMLWSAGNEGCAIMSWGYENKNDKYDSMNNSRFYNDYFINKVNGDYFHFFIRTLYQSYSMLLFSERIQNLSAIRSDYYDDEDIDNDDLIIENRKRIKILTTDINLFLTKNITTSVSHIKHQNDFYNFLMKSFRIDEESQYIIKGIDSLNDLVVKLDEKDDERRKAEEEKRSNKLQSIIGILALFESASVINDWSDLVKDYHGVYVIGLIIILILLALSIYVTFESLYELFIKDKK